MEKMSVLKGFAIVVVDRGFVYVGDVEHDGVWCVIRDAKNIRRWKTTKGLGELANGPLPETVLDNTGTVRVPAHAVIHMIDAEKTRWTS